MHEDFSKANTQIIIVSCDSIYSNLAFCNTPYDKGGLAGHSLNVPVISDFNKDVAIAYGILSDGGLPLRATFVINPQGVIKQMSVNDEELERIPHDILKLVESLQYFGNHGEVCIDIHIPILIS